MTASRACRFLRSPFLPILGLVFCCLCVRPLETNAQAYLWSRSCGAEYTDRGLAVAADVTGNVYVTGEFQNTVDFGGGGLTSAGGLDIFLLKYDASGNHVWSKRFGAPVTDTGRGVTVDPLGGVYITGSFFDPVDFGGGLVQTSGGQDVFLAKFNANGNHVWSKSFGGELDDNATVVCAANTGVYMMGYFQEDIDFGGATMTSAGSADIFIAKFARNGNHLWSRSFGGIDGDVGWGAATDANGNVFMTGAFGGTVDFGGGPVQTAGFFDIFLVKYNGSGNFVWAKRFGAKDQDAGSAVIADSQGNVYLTGFFTQTVDFGGGPLTSARMSDAYIAKYDADGNHLWSKRFGSTGNDQGLALATDAFDNVFVTGFFAESVDFGGGLLTSAGDGDVFVAKYDPVGNHLWSRGFGGTSGDRGFGLCTDGFDHLVVTGAYQYTADFGNGSVTSAGGNDVYTVKYEGGGVPVFFTALAAEPVDGAVRVSWDLFYDEAVDALRLYRRDDGHATGAPLTLPLAAREYIDTDVTPGARYVYTVSAVTPSGNEIFSSPVEVRIPDVALRLDQNYPNPFNPTTTIAYTLAAAGPTTIRIYDTQGHHVTTLFDGTQEAGAHTVTWNGRDADGRAVGTGIYFYVLKSGKQTASKRMVLVK